MMEVFVGVRMDGWQGFRRSCNANKTILCLYSKRFGNVIVVQPDYLNKNENDYVMVITYCNKKFGYIHNIPRSAILSENKKLDEDEKKNLVDYITKKLDLE